MKLAHTVENEGASPPIVLLHSLALDRSMWTPLVEHLDLERTVVTMDLRGHGESRAAPSFTVEDMADDVVETLMTLDRTPGIIVGLSLGGCVAQAVATRHPSHVVALGLVDTTAWYGQDAPERWAERAEKAVAQGMESLSRFQLDRWFGSEFLGSHPEAGERLLEIFASNDIDSYVSACHALGRFDGRSRASSVAVPTVVIVGEQDPATTPEHAAALSASIPGSTLHVIPGAKHLTPVERPQEVAALLRVLWHDGSANEKDD